MQKVGLTQSQLGDIAGYGLSSIQRIERLPIAFVLETSLKGFAAALGMPYDKFLVEVLLERPLGNSEDSPILSALEDGAWVRLDGDAYKAAKENAGNQPIDAYIQGLIPQTKPSNRKRDH